MALGWGAVVSVEVLVQIGQHCFLFFEIAETENVLLYEDHPCKWVAGFQQLLWIQNQAVEQQFSLHTKGRPNEGQVQTCWGAGLQPHQDAFGDGQEELLEPRLLGVVGHDQLVFAGVILAQPAFQPFLQVLKPEEYICKTSEFALVDHADNVAGVQLGPESDGGDDDAVMRSHPYKLARQSSHVVVMAEWQYKVLEMAHSHSNLASLSIDIYGHTISTIIIIVHLPTFILLFVRIQVIIVKMIIRKVRLILIVLKAYLSPSLHYFLPLRHYFLSITFEDSLNLF